jgi:hypothetical protein
MLKNLSLIVKGLVLTIALMAAVPILRIAFDSDVQAQDWRTASREPAGWAPAPEDYTPAIVQAYCARAVRWRGSFGDHCWVAAKPADATQYRRYEVIGFRLRRLGTSVIETDTPTPDRRWYGAHPKLVQDLRGARAEQVIAALPAAVAAYPNAKTYRVWPGPNSNTFIAFLARQIPQFELALPGKALGKDYLGWNVISSAPSGTGFQFSLGGLFGVLLAQKEGLEVNIFGLVIGANPFNPSITIPGAGRIPFQADWTAKAAD